MESLIRETRDASGEVGKYRDEVISATRITIGSAPDCSIQLLGPDIRPQHAELRMRGGRRLEISGQRRNVVHVNGEAHRSRVLSSGDRIELGGNTLVVFDPPEGFDAALRLERNAEVDSRLFEGAFRTDLAQLRLSRRAMSWMLSLIVVIAAFVLPFTLRQQQWHELARLPMVPDDSIWISGPLLPAHELATGADCMTCHRKLFSRVPDQACLDCHAQSADHVDHETLVAATDLPPPERCASCHRDHNEPDAVMVVQTDTLCIDCHRNSDRLFAQLDVAPVEGFSQASHPGFAAHMFKPAVLPAGTGVGFDWRLVVEAVAEATEASNLKFPHEVHLDPEKVADLNSGGALGCADCHSLSLDREHFELIRMQDVCIDCHELTFDPTMPDRQLPHGKPLEVILTIEGQYLRKFSDPSVDNELVVQRRIPDKENRTLTCVNTAFNCAAEAAAGEIQEQFSVRGCVSCHIVEEHADADIYSRYQVHPVRLAEDYFPPARFDHSSHLVMADAIGDAACMECHDAQKSADSSDLLIPDIDKCVECHGDARQAAPVVLQCIDCHSYHPDRRTVVETVVAERL